MNTRIGTITELGLWFFLFFFPSGEPTYMTICFLCKQTSYTSPDLCNIYTFTKENCIRNVHMTRASK